jgi:hypothetical protein
MVVAAVVDRGSEQGVVAGATGVVDDGSSTWWQQDCMADGEAGLEPAVTSPMRSPSRFRPDAVEDVIVELRFWDGIGMRRHGAK